jgi:hypothetical protein
LKVVVLVGLGKRFGETVLGGVALRDAIFGERRFSRLVRQEVISLRKPFQTNRSRTLVLVGRRSWGPQLGVELQPLKFVERVASKVSKLRWKLDYIGKDAVVG